MFGEVVSALALLGLAVGSIWFGAKITIGRELILDPTVKDISELNCAQILMMPITASVTLLTLFYFKDLSQIIFFFLSGICPSFVIFELAACSLVALLPTLNMKMVYSAAIFMSIFVVVEWLNQSVIAHNTLGCAMCIFLLGSVRFPSLKLAVLCLSLLLIYDVFWVFFSEYWFNKNVMVAVATKQTINPVQYLGQKLSLPLLQGMKETVDPPLKLLMPVLFSKAVGRASMMMLGLGDIALPGLVVTMALRFDAVLFGDVMDSTVTTTTTTTTTASSSALSATGDHNDLVDVENKGSGVDKTLLLSSDEHEHDDVGGGSVTVVKTSDDEPLSVSAVSDVMSLQQFYSFSRNKETLLFEYALGGYIVGLLMAFFVARYTSSPQPALLYLCPCTLGAVVMRARSLGKLTAAWHGIQEHSRNRSE